MAKLMGKGHHVARLAEVVQHHIGMHGRHGRVRKGTWRLAGLHACVDPALGEERLGQLRKLGRKGGIGFRDRLAGVLPPYGFRLLDRQGGVAVPDLQLVEAHPFGLQPVIPVRELGIGRNHGIPQRLHDLGLHMVRQVAPMLRRGHLAPAVVDFLFLGERVVDAGKELDVAVEHLGQCPRCRLTLGAVGIGQQVQGGFEVQLLFLTRDLEHQPGHRLVKKLVPRAGADDALVMQETLQLIRKLVRTHGAHAVKYRLVAGKIGIRGQERLQMPILDPVEFKAEEHQRRGEGGHLILRIGHELGALAVHRVLIVAQARVGHDAPGGHVNRLILLHAFQKCCGIKRGELAFIGGGEIGAGLFQPRHFAVVFRCVRRGV